MEMEDIKTSEGGVPAMSDVEAQLKVKYGRVYRVGMTVPEDDEHEVELSYHFKRPSVASYDRYVKSLSQVGAAKASKMFMLDAVVAEDEDRLAADMEEYPGVAISIGSKLTDILGLTNTANLKKL